MSFDEYPMSYNPDVQAATAPLPSAPPRASPVISTYYDSLRPPPVAPGHSFDGIQYSSSRRTVFQSVFVKYKLYCFLGIFICMCIFCGIYFAFIDIGTSNTIESILMNQTNQTVSGSPSPPPVAAWGQCWFNNCVSNSAPNLPCVEGYICTQVPPPADPNEHYSQCRRQ